MNEEYVARLNLADCQFSFESNMELDQPAWVAPEGSFDLDPKKIAIFSFSIRKWDFHKSVRYLVICYSSLGIIYSSYPIC
jgi:hypothetical protein